MAPIRRYLRITKYSVLECRIYLDNPALAQTWLLNPRDPILPRVIESVRPLVLPKLKEENERSKGKGKKSKGVKDVVAEDDFEVSIFLTELSTRHSLLMKQKVFLDKKDRMQSNSDKMVGESNETAIELNDDAPLVRREESDENGPRLSLSDIPVAVEDNITGDDEIVQHSGRSKRKKKRQHGDGGLFIEASEDSEAGAFQTQQTPPPKRKKRASPIAAPVANMAPAEDDKKKMGLSTSYDGFSIYGRILCLVVKRRGNARGMSQGSAFTGAGQAMMEDWIASTQVGQDQEAD